eukprot:Awhi_evm1s6055
MSKRHKCTICKVLFDDLKSTKEHVWTVHVCPAFEDDGANGEFPVYCDDTNWEHVESFIKKEKSPSKFTDSEESDSDSLDHDIVFPPRPSSDDQSRSRSVDKMSARKTKSYNPESARRISNSIPNFGDHTNSMDFDKNNNSNNNINNRLSTGSQSHSLLKSPSTPVFLDGDRSTSHHHSHHSKSPTPTYSLHQEQQHNQHHQQQQQQQHNHSRYEHASLYQQQSSPHQYHHHYHSHQPHNAPQKQQHYQHHHQEQSSWTQQPQQQEQLWRP